MNQTGGFFYHYLAFRNSAKYWSVFRREILDFLRPKFKNGKTLWVGPSAGYSLDKELIKPRLAKDYFVEVDFLSKIIFKLRFGKPLNWITSSAFRFTKDPVESAQLTAAILNSYSVDTVIFCNILGQLPLLYPAAGSNYWNQFYGSLMNDIESSIVSYHDWLTVMAKPAELDELELDISIENLKSEKSVQEFLLTKPNKKREWKLIDHHTGKLSKYSESKCLWRKDKNSLHLMDCISLEKS